MANELVFVVVLVVVVVLGLLVQGLGRLRPVSSENLFPYTRRPEFLSAAERS